MTALLQHKSDNPSMYHNLFLTMVQIYLRFGAQFFTIQVKKISGKKLLYVGAFGFPETTDCMAIFRGLYRVYAWILCFI